MIGNDIVDLSLSRFTSATRFGRYANKICSQQEQAQFGVFEAKHISLWRFWSLKEAAFKAEVRLGHAVNFSPQNIEVNLLSSKNAQVDGLQASYTGFSIVDPGFVYSEAKQLNLAESTIRSIQKRSSELTAHQIFKMGKLPFLMTRSGKLKPASISHHGQYYSLFYIS